MCCARCRTRMRSSNQSRRAKRPSWNVAKKVIATDATMRAAVAALRQRGVAKIVVAAPVGAPDTCREFEHEVDEIVCAIAPEYFQAVGQYYEDFSQTRDEEVRELLARAVQDRQPRNNRGSRNLSE